MKVISAEKMASLEAQAYEEGCSDRDFMEQAGYGIAQVVQRCYPPQDAAHHVLLLCGKGNNGGDAFVAGRYLRSAGYGVTAVQLDAAEHCSPLCRLNRERFIAADGRIIGEFPTSHSDYTLIIDGLFGTGFKGRVREPYAALIEKANGSAVPIFAVDIPSGVDGSTGEAAGAVIQATATCFLELPKTGFFLQQGWNYVGELYYVSFGLPKKWIDLAEADFHLLETGDVIPMLPKVQRSWHKYQRGFAVGWAGSPQMPGAALLSSLAALRSGSGIVKLLHPKGMEAQLAHSPYELIKIPYDVTAAQDLLALMQKATATFVGPGLGRSLETQELLKAVMPLLEKPCVIDADALTLLAENAFSLPKQAVLTPHAGEMARLLPAAAPFVYTMNTLNLCRQYAEENLCTLVLKGPVTYIFHPGQPFFASAVSDPGMATAGSGDVLTGVIASLLSQGLPCHHAALLGVYLHGVAGKSAVSAKQSHHIIASDIIDYL